MKKPKVKIFISSIVILFIILVVGYKLDKESIESNSNYYTQEDIRRILDDFIQKNSETKITLNGELKSKIVRVQNAAMQTYFLSNSETIGIILPDIHEEEVYIKDIDDKWYFLFKDENLNFNSLIFPIAEINLKTESFAIDTKDQDDNQHKSVELSSDQQNLEIEINNSNQLTKAVIKSDQGDIIYKFNYINNLSEIDLPGEYENINSIKYEKTIEIFAPLIKNDIKY